MRAAGDSGSASATAMRMVLLLILGLVVLARGLEYINDRLAEASRGALPATGAAAEAATRAAEAVAAAEGAATGSPSTPAVAAPRPTPARALPAPPDTFVHALQTSDRADRGSALRLLRGYASTPDVQAALAVAASSATSDWERRYIACLRGRDPDVPVGELFEALPTAAPPDAEWRQEPVECLVETIAARASDDPARAGPLLAIRALYGERSAFTDALVRLEPQTPPPDVIAALEQADSRPRRSAALVAAVSLGAAAISPDGVRRWLDDADRSSRLLVIRALLRRGDGPSLALAAPALAQSPGDRDLERLAMQQLGVDSALDRELAALAADPATPDFARAHAVFLVSRAGGEASARSVAALPDRDDTVRPELAAARRAIVQRFGSGRPVR